MVLKVTLHLHVGRLISICISSFHLESIHDTQSRPARHLQVSMLVSFGDIETAKNQAGMAENMF